MADEQQPDILSQEADPRIIQSKREAKRIRARELSDIRKVLSTVEGRRFIYRLWGMAGIFRCSFSANANQTAFNEGKRDIGLAILNDVNKAEKTAFAQMQNEAWSEKPRQEAEE